MGQLAEVLELVHGAADRFETVRGEFGVWRHEARAYEAFVSSVDGAEELMDAHKPEVREHRSQIRLWLDRPDRVRVEREDNSYGPEVAIAAGCRWYRYDPRIGAIAEEGDQPLEAAMGSELPVVLEPSRLMAALRFEPRGFGTRAGREVARCVGHPRARARGSELWVLHSLGTNGEEFELEVDRERGVLLRSEARRGGQPFYAIEALTVVFDEPLSDELFAFSPPAGVEVQPHEPPDITHQLPLHEAAKRAPFGVLIPREVPGDWRLTVSFTEESKQYRIPSSVTLFYSSRDGASQLSISETVAREQGEIAFGTGVPAWEELEENGLQMRVRRRTDRWPQAQLALTRSGTRITMHSNDLDADALVVFARQLIPAPDRPPV